MIKVLVYIFAAFLLVGNVHGAELIHRPVVGALKSRTAKVLVTTTEQANVSVLYSVNDDMADPIESPTRTTDEIDGFSETFRIKNLARDSTYFVDIRVDGVLRLAPPYPSFKTFVGAANREFRVIVLNDFINPNKQTTEFDTFLNASLEEPAFAFIGGDFVHRNHASLDNRREMIQEAYNGDTFGLRDFRDLILDRYGIVHQWDDHGIPGNNQDRLYKPNGDPADWDISREVYESMIPHYYLDHPTSIYHQFKHGQAQFFVLDTRSQRDPASWPDDENKSMLGTDQLDWFLDRLLNSKATWKIVFSSNSINPTISKADSWMSFQNEWNYILEFVETNGINGVVFVSGDIHLGGIDDGTAAGLPTLSVPPANLEPKDKRECTTTGRDIGEWSHGTYVTVIDENGELEPCNGYGVIEVLTSPDRLNLYVKNDKGEVMNFYQLVND